MLVISSQGFTRGLENQSEKNDTSMYNVKQGSEDVKYENM